MEDKMWIIKGLIALWILVVIMCRKVYLCEHKHGLLDSVINKLKKRIEDLEDKGKGVKK